MKNYQQHQRDSKPMLDLARNKDKLVHLENLY